GFAEGAAQPGVAFAGGGGFGPAGGLAGFGRELGPGDQVAGGGGAGHLGADLGDDLLSADDADPGERSELGRRAGGGGDRLLDPGGEGVYLGGERVDPGKHHGQQEGVVLGEVPGERLGQDALFAAHGSAGQAGEHVGIALPGDQRVQ